LRFQLLGPLEFDLPGLTRGWTAIKADKQRTLLGTLLLNANRVVPAHQLYSELWADKPHARANGLLAGCVWRLRAALGDEAGTVLVTRAGGYQLTVPRTALDLHEYEDLVAQGRARRETGDLVGALDSFTRALEVWRGDALADVADTPSIMAERARLEESRSAVVEARCGIGLELGHHEEILPELKLLVSQQPLRERLHGYLMTALYRSGQQADALGTYRDLRQLLVDELGIEPSKPLRELQRRILGEDPSLLVHSGAAVRPEKAVAAPLIAPQLLPPAPPVFVGREAELDALTTRLAERNTVVSVHGVVGVGKTALASAAAHAVADHFPDGRVFLDMRGSAGRPLPAIDAITRIAHSFGVSGPPPDSGDRLMTPWLPELAGRRVLVVLDDVLDLRQVRPLISPPPGWTVLLTGRCAVGAVDCRNHVPLGRLAASTSRDLLIRQLGAPRVIADLDAAAALARLCEHLPLALRIAADKLVSRPDWSLADFADRLGTPRHRLDLLANDADGLRDRLRTSIGLLSRGADTAALRALFLLGDLDQSVVTEAGLAALLDSSATAAHLVADRLVDVGLLESLGIARYRVPAAVRLLAQEMPGDHADDDAVQRVVEHYAASVRDHLDAAVGALDERPSEAAVSGRSPTSWYRRHRALLWELSLRDRTNALPKLVDELRRALFDRRGAAAPRPIRPVYSKQSSAWRKRQVLPVPSPIDQPSPSGPRVRH
jgi:DNA-binding SARP family transcriptional activator